MSNLMNDIFDSSTTLSALRNLKKDADKFRTTLMEDIQPTAASIANFKRTNRVAQSISRWFSNKSDSDNDQSPLENTSEDFDAGFQFNNAEDTSNQSDDNQESSTLNISEEETKSLFNEHTRQMMAVAGKQFESKILNMFEIKKSMNTRVSEILAASNQTNSILKHISVQLDQIIRYQTDVEERLKNTNRGTLFDSSGRMTLNSVMNYIKQNRSRVVKSFTQSVMDMTGLSNIDKIATEYIQTFTYDMIKKLTELPGIKKIFDFRKSRGETDYTNYINPRYDRKQAIFDNMVRKSIVNVIPDYLKKITQFMTGKKFNVNSRGNLTTKPAENQFKSSINVTFDISSFSDRRIQSYTQTAKKKNQDISSADTKEVLRILVSQYVAQMYHGTTNELRADTLKNGGDLAIHHHVLKLLIRSKGGKISYWSTILEAFSTKLQLDRGYREEFAISVNRALKMLDERAKQNLSESQTVTDTKFTQEMFDEMSSKRLSYDSTKFEHEGKTYRQLIKEKIISIDQLTEKQLQHLDDKIKSFEELYEKLDDESYLSTDEKLTTVQDKKLQYAESIFSILNRGINVFYVKRKKPFGPIGLAKQKKDYTNAQTQTIISPTLLVSQRVEESPAVEEDKQLGIFKKIGTKISSVTKQVTDRLKTLFQKMKANLRSDYETFINDPAKQKNLINEASEEDQEKVKEINAMLQTATQNGMSQNDIATIRTKISGISNEKVRTQLKKNVDAAVERGGKKPEASSMLGKALLLVFGVAKKFFGGIFSKIKFFFNKRNEIIMKSIDKGVVGVKQGAKTFKEGLFGTDESKGIVTRVKGFVQPKVDAVKNVVKGIAESKPAQALVNIGKNISEKFKNSNFGKGFMKAFHMGEPSIQTVHDKQSRSIADTLSHGAESVFDTIIDAFNKVGEKMTELFDAIGEKKTGEEAKKKKSKDKPKAKEKENQSMSFAMGMIFGGVSSILTNVMSAVVKALMALKGFQALSKMLNDAIMKVAKPLNKAFQALSKAIQKPLDVITNCLSTIMDSVSDILVSVIEAVVPMLETSLPLIEMMLPMAKTILEIQTSVMKVILAPMMSIFNSVIAPLLRGTGNTQDSLKSALTSMFGLTGTVLGGILSVLSGIAKFLGVGGSAAAAKSVMQTSADMTKSGAAELQSSTQQKAGLYNTDTSIPTSSQSADNMSARTNSSNDIKDFGSPMDGIMGSGDSAAPYKFDDNVQDALSNLKEIASGMLSIFTGGDTDVFDSVKKAEEKEAYKQSQYNASSLTDAEKAQIDAKAFELFKAGLSNEQLTGETDADYRARYEKNKAKYWTMAANDIVHQKVKSVADGTDENASSLINSTLGFDPNEFVDAMDDMYTESEDSKTLEDMMQQYPMNSPEDQSGDVYYDDGSSEYQYYIEGGTGDILQAASEVYTAARKKKGAPLTWRGSVSNVSFDDGMVIDIVSTMCTGMMAATVKRMGYYLPSGGKKYTDKYQGDAYMTPTLGSNSWGLDNADGRPNIYDRNGNKSNDWIIVKDGSHKPGDLTFAARSYKAVHGHMPAYKSSSGQWFSFNGGADDSLANSVKLGEYYLSHGTMPTSTKVNRLGYRVGDHEATSQEGSPVGPLKSGTIRYVGAVNKGGVRKVTVTDSNRYRGAANNGGGSRTGNVGNFVPRTEANSLPEAGNKYYIRKSSGGYSPCSPGNKSLNPSMFAINDVLPNCVGYAFGRFHEILGDTSFSSHVGGNAGDALYNNAVKKGLPISTTPELGAMPVWKYLDNPSSGHIAVVESIEPNGDILTSNSGWHAKNFYMQKYEKSKNYDRKTTNHNMDFLGFILPPVKFQTSYTNQIAGSARVAANSRASRSRATSVSYTSTPAYATSSSRAATSGGTSSANGRSREDWIRTVAMMFEGYMNSGQRSYDGKHEYYDASHVHSNIKLRNGQIVKMRPDCSGTLGSSITAFGYKFVSPVSPPAGWHDDVAGCHTFGAHGRKQYANWKSGWHPPYIANADGSETSDWAFYKTADTPIEPGDIVAWEDNIHNGKKTRHATFAVSGSGTKWRGMDAGGDTNLQESAKVATEYLDTGSTNWRGISVSGMENILRYVGGGSGSYRASSYSYAPATTTASRSANSRRAGTTYTAAATTGTTSRSSRSRAASTVSAARTTAVAANPSAPITGSTNAEKIFNYLTRNKGMSAYGAAGMMGCFEHESGMQPNQLENSFQAKWGYASGAAGDKQYTSDVNSGKESEYNFVHSRGTNKAGYGLPQFTATNVKQDIYNRTVKKGKSIDSLDVQLDAIHDTIAQKKYNGTTLLNAINSASSATEANQYFLWRYEAGTSYKSDAAVNSAYGHDIASPRHKSAEKYYQLYGSGDMYTGTTFDDVYFDSSPITQFMSNPIQGDYIYTPGYENIPYQPMTGPMYIPDLDVNNQQMMYDDELPVIINHVNYTSETQELLQHIDDILTVDYNVKSTTIRNLMDQIYDEFPEYIDWYFSDEDGYSDEELEEDDMEILQMTSNFV